MKKCKLCYKELKNTRNTYCSTHCHKLNMRKEYIEGWLRGEISGNNSDGCSGYIRSYLFDKHDNKCQGCGWGETNPVSNRIPLETHHIDGDWTNNKPDNIQLLCPNCHSITGNYKRLNSGGRDRKKYYADEAY